MLQKLQNNSGRIVLIVILVLLLASIRAFEKILFYDPFLDYFKSDYLTIAFPKFEGFRLLFAMSFRYFSNSLLSIGIIYLLFKDIELIKFTSLLYGVFYVLLISFFFVLIYFIDQKNSFLLFYVRRFLIQPLFLLLFIPAYYYQRSISKK